MPKIAPSVVEPIPTASEIRAPWMMRLQTSRPNELVPIQCLKSGRASACAESIGERIVAADQVGEHGRQHEHEHDDEADGAEQMASGNESELATACGAGAGAFQLAVEIDRGHAAGLIHE